MNKPRIIFMGTPDIAAVCLEKLYTQGQDKLFNIIGVISQPDKPKGRNLHLLPTPVKIVAERLGLECFQPQKARDPESLEWIRQKQPDLLIVVAYGQILPPDLLQIPPLGCINVHTSLLPRWRGAAPIQRAILEGDPETGVSLMKMDAGLDTGAVLSVLKTPVTEADNAQTLHDRLAEMGGDLLLKTLPDYFAGKITPIPQPAEGLTYAKKITKEEGKIDWTQSAESISCRVRAFTPWPGAFTWIPNGEKQILLKIWEVVILSQKTEATPGTILKASGDDLWVATGDGILKILSLQREGKRRMETREFLLGTPFAKAEIKSLIAY